MQIVFEDGNLVVINKPSLMDSQNSKPNRPSVVEWLREHYGYSGLVHRLDFGTSGIMVCAKNAASSKKLTDLLQRGKIKRIYVAIAFGLVSPHEGEISLPLDEKDGLTFYRTLETFHNASFVEVELGTGRKHQIRRHFYELGHPLLGDHLYKKKGSDLLFSRPALHALKLKIDSQVFEAPIPEDFAELLNKLRNIR